MKKVNKKEFFRNLPVKAAYLLLLAGVITNVSHRGGAVAYLLFYFMLMLPVLALSYTAYVYFRFKIVQDVARNVVRATEIPYRLLLANEDPVAFSNISLNFYTEKVSMKGETPGNISLLPHEKIRVDTKMYCKYRGTYPVGVKSVTVTDFFRLFTITYPLMSQVRLTAKPRIIPFQDLKIILQEKDPKSTMFTVSRLQDLPDFELRSYQPGDPVKYIHWKNSAKAGELLVRKRIPEELFETVLFMDLSPVAGDMEKRLSGEDTIIETSISFVHDFYLKKIPIRIVYMENDIQEMVVDANTGFDAFYGKCTDLLFRAAEPVEKVWMAWKPSSGSGCSSILVTGKMTENLKRCVTERQRMGEEVLVVETGELKL